MFGFGKKRGSDEDMELVVLRAASLSHALLLDTKTIPTESDRNRLIDFSIAEKNRKFTKNERQIISLAVLAITSDVAFMNSLMAEVVSKGGTISHELHREFLRRLERIIEGYSDSS